MTKSIDADDSRGSTCSASECDVCHGSGGHWDDESIDQWYWCSNCDAGEKHDEQKRAIKLQDNDPRVVAGFFLGWDNNEPPQLWVWKGEPGDESSESWQRVTF